MSHSILTALEFSDNLHLLPPYMAQAIKIFSKSLTNTDIKKRMAIPEKILPFLPHFNGRHAVKIHLIYGTRTWPIFCSIRKKGYKKPVFSSGWRQFVISNNFNVGDELTLYKVEDEAGSFQYMVQVEKPARASRDLSPPFLCLNHEVDENNGTSLTKACNSQNEQDQLLKAAGAPIIHEEAMTELADIIAAEADALVDFVDHVIAKQACGLFGSNASGEATGNANFEFEVLENKMMFFGITKNVCMGEPPIRSCCMTNEEREIKSLGLAVGDEYYKSRTERLNSLDMIVGQPATPYVGVVNLDLTLAPPIIDGGNY